MASVTGGSRADCLAGVWDGGLGLWRRSGDSQEYSAYRVELPVPVCAVSWNRNNKVVASACADGQVHLSYGNGRAMAWLPLQPDAPQPGPATSLSWSQGSKRLALADTTGNVHVHNMTGRTHSQLHSSKEDAFVTDVAFHPTEDFLAASSSSGAVHLWSPEGAALPHLSPAASPRGGSSRLTRVATHPSEPLVLAGSARGEVLVWDAARRALLSRIPPCSVPSASRVRALQTAAGRPSLALAAHDAGALRVLDLRVRGGQAANLASRAGCSALSLRDDWGAVAAGYEDGGLEVMDPRRAEAPAAGDALLERGRAARKAGASRAVAGLSWQRCGVERANEPSLLGLLREEARAEAGASRPASGLKPPRVQFREGEEPSSATRRTLPALRVNPEAVSEASTPGSGSLAGALSASLLAVTPLDRARAAAMQSPARADPAPGRELRVRKPPVALEPAAGGPEPLAPAAPAPRRAASPESSQEWTIPASPGKHSAQGPWAGKAALAGGGGLWTPGRTDKGDKGSLGADKLGAGSILADKLGGGSALAASASSLALEALVRGVRDDVLALHLDVLNHFQAAQEAQTRAMEEMQSRQEAMASEVAALRRQLSTALQQRDEFRWL